MLSRVFLVLAVVLHVAISVEIRGVKTSENFTHSATLDIDGNYILFWKFNDTHITFEAHVKTKGWIGLGLSTNGQMYPADVVIGWVEDDGSAHFSDRHTTGHTSPIMDTSQDWYLLMAEENEFGTVMKMVRQLVTCDRSDDFDIQDGTNRMIFAYGDHDPTDGDIYYHGNTRGTKSLSLLSAKVQPKDMDDIKLWDFLNDNVVLPNKTTTYWCKGFHMSAIGKHHMIKYEPIISPGNEMMVHHVVLYRCKVDNPEQYHGMSTECSDEARTLPECTSIVIAWAIGGQPFYFPEHVGFSFGGDDDPSFIIMETHYDNPMARADVIDNSGIRVTLSSNLRQHDAGMLELGHAVNFFQAIPPGEADFVTEGHCNELCLEAAFNQSNLSEIKIIGALQHSHLLGVAITTRHYRNGVELKPLITDPHYDFDFQEVRMLPKEVPVYPGDSFRVDCHYDSRGRSDVTLGGLSTQEEMCLTFAYYYPKFKVDNCLSVNLLNYLNLNTEELYRFIQFNADWSNKTFVDSFKAGMKKSMVFQVCLGDLQPSDQDPNHIFMPQETSSPYVPPTPDCS